MRPEPLGQAPIAPQAMSTRDIQTDPLRVVTYNTEYGQDPQGLADAILSTPDLAKAAVFLLQEEEWHPNENGSRAQQLATLLGLDYIYIPARKKGDGTHGLALMSAFPLQHVEKMDLPLANNGVQRIAVACDVQVGDHLVHLIDIHLETRLNAGERVAELHPAVIDAPELTLVAGDFNTNWVTWDGPVPVLGAEQEQVPIINSYMSALQFDAPSADSGPTEHMYGLEFKLDSIYTRGLQTHFGGVDKTGPSDHWPLWIDVY